MKDYNFYSTEKQLKRFLPFCLLMFCIEDILFLSLFRSLDCVFLYKYSIEIKKVINKSC